MVSAHRIRAGRPGNQNGSMTMELVILFPLLVILLLAVFVAGRIQTQTNAVTNAAQNGARAASISRTGADAQTNGYNAAFTTLQSAGLQCQGAPVINVDTRDFDVPVGTPVNPDQPLTVTVTVSCQVSLNDLIFPGLALPGTHTESSSFVSVLDVYRER